MCVRVCVCVRVRACACVCVCVCVQVGVPAASDEVKRDSEGELTCVERLRQKKHKGDLSQASDEEIACVYVRRVRATVCVCERVRV